MNQNPNRSADAYVDGYCLGSGQPGARAGYGVCWPDSSQINVSEPVRGRPTNNAGKIQGATRAINDAGQSGVRDLRIHTDSDLLRKSATEYIPNWKENNWLKANGQRLLNRSDFQAMDQAMRNNPNMNVEFHSVPRDSGNLYNDEANRLAKEGAKRYGRF